MSDLICSLGDYLNGAWMLSKVDDKKTGQQEDQRGWGRPKSMTYSFVIMTYVSGFGRACFHAGLAITVCDACSILLIPNRYLSSAGNGIRIGTVW